MALNFQAPGFVQPRSYEEIGNIPRTLDQIADRYMAGRDKNRNRAYSLAEQRNGLAAQGINPEGYDPEDPASVARVWAPLMEKHLAGLKQSRAAKDLDAQKTTAEIGKLDAEAAKARGAGNPKQLETKERASIEGQIMDDYMKSPTYANLAAAKSGLRDLASIQANKSGAADIAAIYSFIKTMDNNAVKEGEIQLAQSAIPGLDRVKLIYDNLRGGNKLTPEMKRELLTVGRNMYKSKLKSADEFRSPFIKRSEQYGIDPNISVPANSISEQELEAMFQERIEPTGGPQPGAVDGGYRFKGGNPADRANWQKL